MHLTEQSPCRSQDVAPCAVPHLYGRLREPSPVRRTGRDEREFLRRDDGLPVESRPSRDFRPPPSIESDAEPRVPIFLRKPSQIPGRGVERAFLQSFRRGVSAEPCGRFDRTESARVEERADAYFFDVVRQRELRESHVVLRAARSFSPRGPRAGTVVLRPGAGSERQLRV